MDSENPMAKEGSRLDKRLFTVNERVLLHLKESGSTGHSLDLPAPMTQDGIADALDIRVNHVSRAVKGLQKQGCVREAVSRVKGEVRRRKIYLVTEEGMAVANRVLNQIAATVVSVRDSRQRLREMPAADARQLLAPPRTFTSLLANLDDRGVLDVYKAKAKKKRKDAVSRFTGAPTEAPFHGRENEVKKLRSWLQQKKPPIMAITGEQGIGKTALALNVARSLDGKRPLCWFTIPPGAASWDIVIALSEFLHELGRPDFPAWARGGEHATFELRKRLESAVIGLGALFVIDQVPGEPEELDRIVSIVVEAAAETGNMVLLTARELPEWRREMKGRGMLEEMTLHGLDVESCRKLAPNLHEKEFLKIYKLARGSPLEIKLLSDQADEHAGHEELTPEEMALLRYLRLLHERRVR
jgi:DNA-binding MarR family transcriptional regulator